MTVDPQLGLVYLPVESPTSDYYGGERPGNNLFGESLVCVDIKTGKRKWYFQIVHHPIWDYDLSSAPLLADIDVDGKAHQSRRGAEQGSVPVCVRSRDRQAGLADRGAPGAADRDVPGEKTSPTQPFPTKPPAYARNFIKIPDDLIDFTPEMRADAIDRMKSYRVEGMFTPPRGRRSEALAGRRQPRQRQRRHQLAGRGLRSRTAHRVRAGRAGLRDADFAAHASPGIHGHQATSPDATISRSVKRRVPDSAARRMLRRRARPRPAMPAPAAARPRRGRGAAAGAAAGIGGLLVEGLPIVKPPYGVISAINLDKGDISWQVPYGETPDNVRRTRRSRG